MRTCFNGVIGEITSLPGCSQIAVSHSVFLPLSQRGKDLAIPANKERQSFCFNEMLYDYMLCTINTDNKAQKRVLEKTGWRKLDSFVSRKTQHLVEIWGKNKY